MNEFRLKQLISKLTGVELVKQGMAAAVGQVELKQRDIKWIRYTAESANQLPANVQGQIGKRIDGFRNNFIQHVPQEYINTFESLIFVWAGKDESITDADINYVNNSNLPNKAELIRVADFIRENNIPLWLTPEEYEQSNASKRALVGGSFNGSERYLAENGWAWGATSKETGLAGRHLKVVADKDVKEFTGRDGEMTPQMKEKIERFALTNSKLVQQTVVEMDDTFGIALKDRATDELLPMLSSKWSPQNQQEEDTIPQDVINKAKGGLQNLFVTRTRTGGMFSILPGQYFLLANFDQQGIPTANPKAFPPLVVAGKSSASPAFEGRTKVEFSKYPGVVFKLAITTGGKMYWIQDKEGLKYPVTKEQAEFLCPNRYFQMSTPPATEMHFENEEQKRQFETDCALLNELRRFLKQSEQQNEPNKKLYRHDYVAGQMWHILTVGPESPESIQTAPGTVGAKLVNPLRQEQEGDWRVTGEYTRKRAGWGIYKNEIPIVPKEDFIPQVASAVQGKHGMELDTLEKALSECVNRYGLSPDQIPPRDVIKGAQATLEAANKNMADQQKQAYEAAGIQTPAAPAEGAVDDRAVVQAPQPQLPAPQPQEFPANPGIAQPNNIFNLQAKTIINKLKKLGQ